MRCRRQDNHSEQLGLVSSLHVICRLCEATHSMVAFGDSTVTVVTVVVVCGIDARVCVCMCVEQDEFSTYAVAFCNPTTPPFHYPRHTALDGVFGLLRQSTLAVSAPTEENDEVRTLEQPRTFWLATAAHTRTLQRGDALSLAQKKKKSQHSTRSNRRCR